jgi:hypothetical protein
MGSALGRCPKIRYDQGGSALSFGKAVSTSIGKCTVPNGSLIDSRGAAFAGMSTVSRLPAKSRPNLASILRDTRRRMARMEVIASSKLISK